MGFIICKKMSFFLSVTAMLFIGLFFTGCAGHEQGEEEIVLRVSNWAEYIDEGDWDEDDAIELDEDNFILGENSMIDDFEDWFYDNYGKKVRVEYSTFGTCEELYNQLTIGDVYDLACPSEYMIMKLAREGWLKQYSEGFYDKSKEYNYYAKGVSPYISSVFKELSIEGHPLDAYAAGYMWGTLGIVYNPDFISADEASHWNILRNDKFYRQVTIKDSVRDAFFAAVCMNYYNEITDKNFTESPDYHDRLSEILNRTDENTVESTRKILTDIKNNAYSFETDSGKADMVTGKVLANEQWSGDAVYTMDQAEEDGCYLCYSAPEEGTNLWFDGWVMLKDGIGDDPYKQFVAESFVNYVSRPDNVVRNMYYIGYTSVISGGDSPLVYEYADYTYGAEEEEEETVAYPVSYFFTGTEEDPDEKYTLYIPAGNVRRQVYAAYPPKEIVDRSVVMACFPDEGNERINRMWTSVRCFDLESVFK